MNTFLVQFIEILSGVLYVALIGRVVLSWLNLSQSNPLYPLGIILYQITEPILAPLRRLLPSFGMLDLSPMVAIILIRVIQALFVSAVS